MSEPRCMPNQYYANEHSPFGTKYTYQAPHDIQKMLNAEYHKGKSSELQTGDVIRLCQTRTGINTPLVAEATITIVDKGPQGAVIAILDPVRSYGDPGERGIAAVIRPDFDGDTFADSSEWKAEWRGPAAKWCVLDGNGEKVAEGIDDKDTAHGIARGDLPVPVREGA